jgi:hypothetical protein
MKNYYNEAALFVKIFFRVAFYPPDFAFFLPNNLVFLVKSVILRLGAAVKTTKKAGQAPAGSSVGRGSKLLCSSDPPITMAQRNAAGILPPAAFSFSASSSMRCPEDAAEMTELSSGGFGTSSGYLTRQGAGNSRFSGEKDTI